MCVRAQIAYLLRRVALTITHPKLLHVVQRDRKSLECRQESYTPVNTECMRLAHWAARKHNASDVGLEFSEYWVVGFLPFLSKI